MEVSCGEGTVEHDGSCWPFDPNDETAPTTVASPPGGTVIEAPFYVLLESDEPATIYYTLDGSEPLTLMLPRMLELVRHGGVLCAA